MIVFVICFEELNVKARDDKSDLFVYPNHAFQLRRLQM